LRGDFPGQVTEEVTEYREIKAISGKSSSRWHEEQVAIQEYMCRCKPGRSPCGALSIGKFRQYSVVRWIYFLKYEREATCRLGTEFQTVVNHLPFPPNH
jgi:hypothetical protein